MIQKIVIKKLIRHSSLKVIQKISIEEEFGDETKCQWWVFGEEALTPSNHKSSLLKQQYGRLSGIRSTAR